jgi:RNA polymerase sigma-70 factor (ECF subfamily)
LSQLSPDYQQVLTLRFISGLSHAETGRVLNRSEEAVRVLQYRALNALRQVLNWKPETR